MPSPLTAELADVDQLPAGGHVVHLVGRVTDVVFGFLGPMTIALVERGVTQTVILLDDPTRRHLLPRFHPSIRLVLIPADKGPLRRFGLAFGALIAALDRESAEALHLHGILPSLIGVGAKRFAVLPPTLFFSPHGSKSLGPFRLVGSSLIRLLRPLSGQGAQRAIVNTRSDAAALRRLTKQEVQVVESPVERVFLEGARSVSLRPLLVTGSRLPNPSGAAMFAQLAVLFSEETLDVQCNWLGIADAESLARLEAAHVGLYECSDAVERATRVGAAWAYIAFGGSLGFPMCLAEAMAMGLPCIVWDTPYHRDLVDHDVTGLICNSMQQLLEAVGRLIDSAALRERLGGAAREMATKRFDSGMFRNAFLEAYRKSHQP